VKIANNEPKIYSGQSQCTQIKVFLTFVSRKCLILAVGEQDKEYSYLIQNRIIFPDHLKFDCSLKLRGEGTA